MHAARLLHEAKSIVVLTGAGISAESGLATFRDPEEGLWSKYDPMELATIDAFERDPELVTRWYVWRFARAQDAQPNPGHEALAQLEQWINEQTTCNDDRSFTLITQNVDGLHQRAGSHRVIEIHGSILRWRCTNTGAEKRLDELCFDQTPVPSEHGGIMRPCVVWFGEMLPEKEMIQTQQALESCDLFLSIGTSGQVQPVASFVSFALSNGARTIEINRDPTPMSEAVDLSIMGLAGEILPRVIDAIISFE